MIDLLVLDFDHTGHQALLDNPRLDFKAKHSTKTGEMYEYPQEVRYRCIDFKLWDNGRAHKANPGKITYQVHAKAKGSIHKYADYKGQNWKDFDFTGVVRAIMEFCREFRVNPFKTPLRGFEFAVNVVPHVPTKQVLDNLLIHRGQVFESMHPIPTKSFGRECAHEQMIIKIYDKAKDCGLPEPLLRFEIKVLKMHYVAKLGIHCLADLLDPEKLLLLAERSVKVWHEIIMFDPSIAVDQLPPKDQDRLKQYRHPTYWLDFDKDSRSSYDYNRKLYWGIVEGYSKHRVQHVIGQRIISKWNELLKPNMEIWNEVFDFLIFECE